MFVFASVGSSTEKKSDGNPVKRMENLGKNLSEWAENNLCRDTSEGKKCLKSQETWSNRVLQVSEKLRQRYEKCGSVPDRSRRRREEDDDDDFSNDMSQEMFDWITSDTYTQTKVASGVMQRYSKSNPAKAVSQLCTAISKWTKDYLQDCNGLRNQNNGYLQTVLRMAKWKVILHNAYLKAQKIEPNETNKDSLPKKVPGDGSQEAWRRWFDRKTLAQKFR